MNINIFLKVNKWLFVLTYFPPRANSNISDSLHRYNKQIRLQVFDDLKQAFSDYEDELLERQKENL